MLMVFHPNGKVEFTRNQKLLAIAPDGRLSVTRMSEILFHEEQQLFYIQFLTGYFKGHYPSWWPVVDVETIEGERERELAGLWEDFCHENNPALASAACVLVTDTPLVFFKTYEDAVSVEIAFIDMLRERGIAVQ